MKTLFIEAKRKDLKLDKNILKNFPKKQLAVFYSIQYKSLAEQIKQELETKGIEIIAFSQILGCKIPKVNDSVLLVGSGRFHALQIINYNENIEVYIFENNKINKIREQEIEKFKQRKKAQLNNFYNADKIGIFVSTKPGQQNLKQALELKNKLKAQNKNPIIYIGDNLYVNELENFDIDVLVNTACPGLALDNKIINSENLKL